MAHTLHDSTMSGITWKAAVSEQISEHLVMVLFTKAGKNGLLLKESRPWDATCKAWRGTRPSKIPKYLWALVESRLQEFEPREKLPATKPPSRPLALRRSFPGASESIGNGRISFPSFLAMELIEGYCADPFRNHTAQAH
ncbi:hypothetical protein [Cyanobium sp. ATX-6F1]|uniref:hypothetical protein n=2 Tax=unclassified Cyanobium TaxID=2627006 RepID=UPI0039BE34CC